jgi:hypothetical protein
MNAEPAVLRVARTIAPQVRGRVWAIGGTTLLHHHGIHADAPRDLDTFTTPEDFATVAAACAQLFGPGVRTQSTEYVSDEFLRFTALDGTQIDLIAGAAAMHDGVRKTWYFDPKNIDIADGLPWMKLEDWLALYALFKRAQRVAQIEQYLRRRIDQR